ncbi:MAG: hypothetical protein Q8K52_02275 [Thiobacillus sp.]|nr:hypothetical protein [Thiobacillus sp.]
MINGNRGLLFLVRVGIAGLVIANLLYVFSPETIYSFTEFSSLRQVFIDVIENYSGFDQDWLLITSLVAISIYIYAYLAIIIVTANLLCQPKMTNPQSGGGRDQWNLLSYVILGLLGPQHKTLNSAGLTTESRSMFCVVSAYSKSREGIGSVALDVVSVVAVSYIGYTALQAPPAYGGLLTRLVDGLMVGLWCYCIFSILMWFVFILAAWFQHLGRRA